MAQNEQYQGPPRMIFLQWDSYDDDSKWNATWSRDLINDDDEPYYRHCIVSNLMDALKLIRGDSCEKYTTGLGACIQARPNGRNAKYEADRWCDSCIAHDVIMWAGD